MKISKTTPYPDSPLKEVTFSITGESKREKALIEAAIYWLQETIGKRPEPSIESFGADLS